MPSGFFYDETNKDKLLVLYLIKALDIELTRGLIADFSTANDIISYFDVQTTVGELEESGLLAAVPKAFGQAYMLTAEGRQTLEMFQERIPQSQRDKLDRYADAWRDKLRLQTQYYTSARELAGGGCLVTLKAMESNRNVLAIEMLLPDTRTANKAVANWREKSADVYMAVYDSLIGDNHKI